MNGYLLIPDPEREEKIELFFDKFGQQRGNWGSPRKFISRQTELIKRVNKFKKQLDKNKIPYEEVRGVFGKLSKKYNIPKVLRNSGRIQEDLRQDKNEYREYKNNQDIYLLVY